MPIVKTKLIHVTVSLSDRGYKTASISYPAEEDDNSINILGGGKKRTIVKVSELGKVYDKIGREEHDVISFHCWGRVEDMSSLKKKLKTAVKQELTRRRLSLRALKLADDNDIT